MFSEDILFVLSIILAIVYFKIVPLYYDKGFHMKPIRFTLGIISWFIYVIICMRNNFYYFAEFTMLYITIFLFRSIFRNTDKN